MVQSMNSEKKRMDICLQYVLSVVAGYAFLYLCISAGTSISRELGVYAMVSISTVTYFLDIIKFLFLVIGGVIAIVLSKLAEHHRAAANTAVMILYLVLQVMLIFACLVLGPKIGSLYGVPQEVLVTLIETLRAAVIPMVLFSAASAAAGIAVKKKSFLLIFLIELAAFVLSLTVMYISAYDWGWGVRGIAMSLGIMQPVAVLLPNVGVWDYSRNVQETVPTYYMGMQAGKSGNQPAAAQMFCPTCGARLSAEAKYCSRCGAERNILL